MKVACVVLLSLALTGALAQDGVCNCNGNTPCKHNDNGTCMKRVNEAGQDVETGGVCTAGSTDCTDLLDGSTAFDSPATHKQENAAGHVGTDTVFGPGNTAPKCFYDPVSKHTYVHYTSALHPSFKCHHVDASGEKATDSDATHCKCTATHPTHHAGGCQQIGDLKGNVHNLGGVCSDYGHSGWKDYSRTSHAHNGAAAGETLTDVTVVQKLKIDGVTGTTFDVAAQMGVRRAVAKQLDGVEPDQVGISNIRAVFAASRRRLAESTPTSTLCAPQGSRLFQKGVSSTRTLQECKDLCAATANCNAISYGLPSGSYARGCIGCADTAGSYADDRFEAYTADAAMTQPFVDSVKAEVTASATESGATADALAVLASITVVVPSTPTTIDESTTKLAGATVLVKNAKCSISNRLFRHPNFASAQHCAETCQATSGCSYFSFGERDALFPGVCIGCSSGIAETHAGIDFYAMGAADDLDIDFKPIHTDKKCEFHGARDAVKDAANPNRARLFGTADGSTTNTAQKCGAMCKADPACKYFSFGHRFQEGDNHITGVCMGCDAASFDAHAGFDVYEVSSRVN